MRPSLALQQHRDEIRCIALSRRASGHTVDGYLCYAQSRCTRLFKG